MNQNGVGPAILSLCSQRAVVEARSCFVPRVVPPLLSSRTLPVSEWPVRYKRKRRKKTCLPGFCASEFRSCVKVEVAWNHTEFGHNPKSCSEISTHRDSAVPKARCLPRPVRHAHTTHTHTRTHAHTHGHHHHYHHHQNKNETWQWQKYETRESVVSGVTDFLLSHFIVVVDLSSG